MEDSTLSSEYTTLRGDVQLHFEFLFYKCFRFSVSCSRCFTITMLVELPMCRVSALV